jgi:pimeloyl-ACP methyl ester carboxylesterase
MAATNFALLHGGGQGSWVWRETIAALKAQSGGAVNCLALDAPGCGTKRGRETSTLEFDDIARELNADIQAGGMTDVVLVGHSQAGTVMPRMVELTPNLFSRLTFIAADAPPPGKTIFKLMGSCLHGEREDRIGWPADPKATREETLYGLMMCNDMASRQRDEFLANLNQDMWPLSSYKYCDWRYDHLVSIPSTFVMCLQDMSLPRAWQERFAETLNVDTIVRIDAGHQVMNTRPQALAEILLAEVGE